MHSQNTANEPNPSGLCQCGCGERTPLARQSITKQGIVRGKPTRFIRGHYRGGSPKDGPMYAIEDCGYETPCWVWQRKITNGYAYLVRDGKTLRAARYFYEQVRGPIPDGLTIDHLCRNRACVNPDHLEAVTITENIRRRPATKLTDELAGEIRRLSSTMNQAELAERFDVHQSTVSRVLSNETWQ